MNHEVSKTANATTITVAKGDTITVTLPYDNRPTRRTAWSFGDNYSYNTSLTLDSVVTRGGVRTMIFTAVETGTVEISMHQYWVLGIEENHITDRFKLTVRVAQ